MTNAKFKKMVEQTTKNYMTLKKEQLAELLALITWNLHLEESKKMKK